MENEEGTKTIDSEEGSKIINGEEGTKTIEGEEEGINKSAVLTECIYKELAKINGKINKMTHIELTDKLRFYHLDTGGTDDVLRKRLKNHYKKIKLSSADMYLSNKLLPFYVIVDFEATCESVNPPDYEHEIIEFPAVLVDSATQEIKSTFQKFCKPVVNPILSEFCIELTGISQKQVDEAESFVQVLKSFQQWLAEHQLDSKDKFAIVTDGPWDMTRFLHGQCRLAGLPYPPWAQAWVNLRKAFSNFYRCQRFCLRNMLDHISMVFEGRPHCGFDDAHNIARILLRMMCDGATLQCNERIAAEEVWRGQHWANWEKGICQKLEEMKLEASFRPVKNDQPVMTYEKVRRQRGIIEAKIAKQMLKAARTREEEEQKGRGEPEVDEESGEEWQKTKVRPRYRKPQHKKNKPKKLCH